ncbi:unnamed protein product [Heligmosomoides polygyrus]|uniref:CCHC-type domain-containing protein n=1 Tax=Heligmosomoides polygyrus TaxID=6339 RepID=A0A183G0A2_HELPZ|nr:unnamed protein product [Heligmosomoides polygyrus]
MSDHRLFDHFHSASRTAQETEKEISSSLCHLHGQIKVAATVINEWTHHLIQHTCSDSCAGEQVLLLGRLLRTAAITREKILRYANQFLLLDSVIRLKIKNSAEYKFKNISVENVTNTVKKNLNKLDDAIDDMEFELGQVEKLLNDEKLCFQEIKNLLASLNQKAITFAPLRCKDSRAYSPDPALSESKNPTTENIKKPKAKIDKKGSGSDTAAEEVKPLTDEEYLEWLIEENSAPCEDCGYTEAVSSDEEDVLKAKRQRLDDNSDKGASATSENPEKIIEIKGQTHIPEEDATQTQPTSEHDRRRLLEQELNQLRFSLEYLPKRRIGESSRGVDPHVTCCFCKEVGWHYSDSCPVITSGDERWRFVRENKLCQYCLRSHGSTCRDKNKKCWYCSVIEKTVAFGSSAPHGFSSWDDSSLADCQDDQDPVNNPSARPL